MIRSFLLFVLALIIIPTISSQRAAPAEKWLTLSGKAPIVAARGGFSGQFPYGSMLALENTATIATESGRAMIYCDLHLSNDSIGFCLPSITLDNSTSVARMDDQGKKTYTLNGKKISGWFAADYSSFDLINNVTYFQNVLSRSSMFDDIVLLTSLDEYVILRNETTLWLNIQYEEFYNEKDLSPIGYTEKIAKNYTVLYVSSPEIGMLKALKVKKQIKRVLQILGKTDIEPSTKKTYGEILEDLPAIKAFATGIIVPKEYIWGVKKDKYLEDAPTTLVTDAHKAGLEVYASVFANDQIASLNYTMDPVMEYLQFIDNSQFAVDGLISDFLPTAEHATMCFAHNSNARKSPEANKTVVVSHNGASGVYPGSTDLAYEQAIADGADIIDCSVQITKDGVVFCMDAADLISTTTALTTFMSRKVSIPDIQHDSGIFSFDLTWAEIQTLKPQIFSPYGYQGYHRDPHNKYKGKFVTLVDFIQLAKTKKAPGILIGIENVGFLAKKRGLDIIGKVTSALKNESLDGIEVTILSSDTQVLSRFKEIPTYKRLFRLDEVVESVPKATTDEVKKYAQGVVVRRHSVLPTREPDFVLTHETRVVTDLHAAELSVYVFYLRNEFVSLAFDYTSDPTRELATLIAGYIVDGVITDFPATASRYLKNKCFDITQVPSIQPILPGELIRVSGVISPAGAPGPALGVSDVVDPPLPPVDPTAAVSSPPPPAGGTTAVAPAPKRSGASGNVANVGLSLLMLLLLLRFLLNVDY